MNAYYDYNAMIRTWHAAYSILRHRDDDSRRWWRNQAYRNDIHPVVHEAMLLAPPAMWQTLLLEHPYISETDATRLAYTRDERAGMADRQTITTVGKYLKRHFPSLPDHTIRQLAGLYSSDGCKIVYGVDELVRHVNNGPKSCMQGEENEYECDPHHPYEVYTLELGWGMAVRLDGYGMTVGRALVWVNPDDESDKRFVRSYKKVEHGYSPTDEILESWIIKQGYSKANRSGWEGASFKLIWCGRHNDKIVAPYIDGATQNATVNGREGVVTIDSDGDWECNKTNGVAEERDRMTCEDCGDRTDEDDGSYVGYSSDCFVCGHCRDHNYVYVLGRRRNNYYIPDGDAVFVESTQEHYDAEYLHDNGIVTLHDGDYAEENDAVYVNSVGDWYLHDDDDIVCDGAGEYQLAEDCVQLHDGDWCLEADAWQCAATSNWYANDDVDPVELDGETYHPDNVPVDESQEELFERA